MYVSCEFTTFQKKLCRLFMILQIHGNVLKNSKLFNMLKFLFYYESVAFRLNYLTLPTI